MVSSGMLRRVALVRTDVSEEPGASFIRVTRIGELGTQVATSVAACVVPSSPIYFTYFTYFNYFSYLLLTLFLAQRFLPP
jgi:hypothetical protein